MARGTLLLLLFSSLLRCCCTFTAQPSKHLRCGRTTYAVPVPVPIGACSLSSKKDDISSTDKSSLLREEAELLLEKARAIRSELPEPVIVQTQTRQEEKLCSPWNVRSDGSDGVTHRLYIDIGREEGTWMDPRWGASGRRIEFTLDVKFTTPSENGNAMANAEERGLMVKDNFGGKSSSIYVLQSAKAARLRGGFEEMKCHGGAYRIDKAGNGGMTARFYIRTDGTPEQDSSYGDVSVPSGCLYFSLPVFGGVTQLSKKEGLLTVRQIGWHTGWRREESRMVGTFRAVPIDDAKRRDGF